MTLRTATRRKADDRVVAQRKPDPAARALRKGKNTRAAVLAAAAALFAENGYDRTGMVAIADAVGISAPALYYHFASKEEILYFHLEQAMTEITTSLRNAVNGAGPAPVDRLAAFVRTHIACEIGRIGIMPLLDDAMYGTEVLMRAIDPEQRETITALQRDFVDTLRGVLRDGQKAGDFEIADVTATAFAIIGMTDHVVNWFRPGNKLTPDALGEIHADLALKMVGVANCS